MPELGALTPYQLKIPDDNQFFQPQNLPFRNWSPQDFESAYQYGPKPLPIDAYSGFANAVGTLANQFTPQTQAANAQARLAGYNATGALNAEQNAGSQLAQANDPNNALPNTPVLAPASNLSDGTPTDQSGTGAPNLSGASSSSAPVSNASAAAPDGSRTGLATVFAGPNDLAAYNAAIADGKSEDQALAVGDNGIGKWGAQTSNPDNLHVALPLSTLAAHGISEKDAPGTPVTVQYNGKSVAATVGDVLPDNAKNGAAIDLNPGVANALGVDPNNFKGQVAFNVGAAHSADSPVAPIGSTAGTSDLPQNSSAPANAPLFGFQPNVASGGTPPSQVPSGLVAANKIISGPQMPVGADLPMPKAIPAPRTPILTYPPIAAAPAPSIAAAPAPVLAPTPVAPSAWQQQLTNALGPGHLTVGANGGVGYETLAPISSQQAALANAEIQAKNADLSLIPARTTLANADARKATAEAALAERNLVPMQPAVDPGAQGPQIIASSTPITATSADTGATTSPQATPSQVASSPTDVKVPYYTTKQVPGYYAGPGQFVENPNSRTYGLVKQLNPAAASDVNNATTHGVATGPFIDANGQINLTQLGNANGKAAQRLAFVGLDNTFKSAPTVQPFLTVAGNNASIQDNVALPPAQRTAVDDDALMKSVAGIENPGGKPGEGELNSLAKTAGFRDDYNTTLNNLGNKKRLLSDQQVADMGAAAQRKVTSLKPSFQAQLDQLTNQAKAVGIDPNDAVSAPTMQYYNSLGTPKVAPAASNAAPPTAGMVKMKSPSGGIGYVPAAQAAAAQAKGGQIVQ